jgi:hypothetical protein
MELPAADRSGQPRVVTSFENPEKDHCVDIFVRADGSYGYEEWRREPEDPGRWFRARYFSAAVFGCAGHRRRHAQDRVVRRPASLIGAAAHDNPASNATRHNVSQGVAPRK